MIMWHAIALTLGLSGGSPPAAEPPRLRFVVMGHIRGREQGLNPLFVEELEQVRRLRPDLVLIPGDAIWGDIERFPSDSAIVESEWDQVDSALATLGVPILRVPGNHDMHDGVTAAIWRRRYGDLPVAHTQNRVRFLLLNDIVLPGPGEGRRDRFLEALDSTQRDFIRQQLSDTTGFDVAFAAFHHLLWWAPDSAAWWREVHPLFRNGRVRAVFSDDLGPLKFSHLERDGVHYYQTAIETQPSLDMLRVNPVARSISAQLDNFLYVTVEDTTVHVEVRVVGAESSGRFTPERYRDVYQAPLTREQRVDRLREAVGGLKRLALVVALVLGLTFLAGGLAGSWWRSRH